MPKQQPRRHVLLNARVIAALGLVGLGGTLGLTLLTARILPLVGFGISTACAAGVIWMYAPHLRHAYSAIGKRTPYRGPAPQELLIAPGAAVVLLLLSGWVLSIVLMKELPGGRATLEPGVPTFVKIPPDAGKGFINVQLANTGQLDAQDARILMIGRVSSVDLPLATLTKDLDVLAQAVEEADKSKSLLGLHAQIRPNSAAVITLEDVPADQWLKLASGLGSTTDSSIMLTDAQWTDFQRGQTAIYVMYAARYSDEGHSG